MVKIRRLLFARLDRINGKWMKKRYSRTDFSGKNKIRPPPMQ